MKFTRVFLGVSLLTFVPSIGLSDSLKSRLPGHIQVKLPVELSSKAFAKPKQSVRYFRPPISGRPRNTSGGATRGCPKGYLGSISLFAPDDHVGLTASARPTFSWYAATAPSAPMQFTLVEPGVPKPVFTKKLKINKSGIVQLQLPEHVPELSVGKEYRWTVSLVCNLKRPSQNIHVRSWIGRKPLVKNTNFNNANELAAFYAQSGFWYDAIAVISKAYSKNPQDTSSANNLKDLLNQVGLSEVVSSQLPALN